jgi:hypothetical protein
MAMLNELVVRASVASRYPWSLVRSQLVSRYAECAIIER